ncbi:MAG: dienelactone hydrolase family protein, partial [Anaerolineales bacterium]
QIIHSKTTKPSYEHIKQTVQALLAFVDDWSASVGMQANQFDLMGFSQGAAMTYAIALLHPERVWRLAALSGFIPENGEALLTAQQFSGKPVFISHGREDDLIPVEQARRAVALFKGSGAQVTYCESDAGHKVSKECLKELEIFLMGD